MVPFTALESTDWIMGVSEYTIMLLPSFFKSTNANVLLKKSSKLNLVNLIATRNQA